MSEYVKPVTAGYNQLMLSDKFMQAAFSNNLVTPFSAPAAQRQISRSNSTMNAIKSYMLSHQLKPGDPLPSEAALCSQLGVSRSSVREALRQLEALDVIDVHRGKGSFVGAMSMQPLIDTLLLKNALERAEGNKTIGNIAQIRIAIDLGVAPQLVTAMKGSSNPQLRSIIGVMLEKTEHGELFPDEDIAFHTGMMSYLNNTLITELMSAMWFVYQSLLPNLDHEAVVTKENLAITARSHGEMLDAAEAGDLCAYTEAVHRHYTPLQQLIASAGQESA